MSEHVFNVTDAEFESEVLNADQAVIVDYWAPWCGPCKMFGPVFEEVASELNNQIKFVKVNVDDSRNTAMKYGVRGIPTIMIFKNKEVVATKVSAMSKAELIEFIQEHA